MMQLQTKVAIESKHWISYTNRLAFWGSCFANTIGDKFTYYGYNTLVNPFGTVYNPQSIAQQLAFLTSTSFDWQAYIVKAQDNYVSLLHNTTFQSADRENLVQKIETVRQRCIDFLRDTDFVFITLGTSWVYQYKATERYVANCHKLPAHTFSRHLLSLDDIKKNIASIHDSLKQLNSDINIIFTISPVRHIKDGLHANQISKAYLFVGLTESLSNKVVYFPSYELIMDECRDYRFYSEDLVHVNAVGVDYIWEKLNQHWLNPKDKPIQKQVEGYRKLCHHKVRGGADEVLKQQELIEEKRLSLNQKYSLNL